MKKFLIASVMIFACMNGFAEAKTNFPKPAVKKYLMVKDLTALPADPCLDAALNAQANAFASEYLGHSFCANSVSNGSIAVSEYGGCCYAFTTIRQLMVAYIQSSFVPCPSGNGVGIM